MRRMRDLRQLLIVLGAGLLLPVAIGLYYWKAKGLAVAAIAGALFTAYQVFWSFCRLRLALRRRLIGSGGWYSGTGARGGDDCWMRLLRPMWSLSVTMTCGWATLTVQSGEGS
jgi:hypothetical protein